MHSVRLYPAAGALKIQDRKNAELESDGPSEEFFSRHLPN